MPIQEKNLNQTQSLGSMPAGQCACETSREKYWRELAIEEKIERMRSIVRSLREQQEQTAAMCSRLFEDFTRHEHKDGLPLVTPGFRPSFGLNKRHRDGEDCYF